MPKATLHDRLITGLQSQGWKLDQSNSSLRYTRLSNPEFKYYYYVGSAGALRRGRTITASVSITGRGQYEALLAKTERDGSASLEAL